MIFIFTGGRDYKNAVFVDTVVANLDLDFAHIYVGDCPSGLDFFAQEAAKLTGIKKTVFRADWGSHGKAAGPIRNREMLMAACASGAAVCVFAFPGGRGTADCVKQAKKLGVPVFTLEE